MALLLAVFGAVRVVVVVVVAGVAARVVARVVAAIVEDDGLEVLFLVSVGQGGRLGVVGGGRGEEVDLFLLNEALEVRGRVVAVIGLFVRRLVALASASLRQTPVVPLLRAVAVVSVAVATVAVRTGGAGGRVQG